MFLVGPSTYLPNDVRIMAFGQSLIGIFGPMMMVPAIPEMINSASVIYPSKIIEITDISSGIFSCFLGIGTIIAPVFGSYITKITSFRFCSDIVGLILLTYCTMYFIFGEGIIL